MGHRPPGFTQIYDHQDESGQALVLALVVLLVGTLLVSGFLYFASTSQRAVIATEAQTRDRFSADAGAEHAMWRIKNESAFRQTVADNGPQSYNVTLNNTAVSITVTQIFTAPGSGGSGPSPPTYGVLVEPSQSSFVPPNGGTHTFDVDVINAGYVLDTFETSMVLRFETQSGNIRWTIEVLDGSGSSVYGPNTFQPPGGVHTTTIPAFDTTPTLDTGAKEPYQIIVTKGNQGGQNDSLAITFTACSLGAAGESPPQTVCDSSTLSTDIESNNTPAIGLRKTADPTAVHPGDTITYTISAENVGNGDADTVEVIDTLPDEENARFVVGSTIVSAGTFAYSNDDGATWGYSPVPDSDNLDGDVDALRWSLIDLAAGVTETLTFQVRVNDPFTSTATLIRNEATATWTQNNDQFGPTSSSFNNPILLPPVYEITSVAAGTTITAITEFNQGQLQMLSWEIGP